MHTTSCSALGIGLLLLQLLSSTAFAKGDCPDSAAVEQARVQVSSALALIACASPQPAPLFHDLTIYRLGPHKDERERLLDGDAAMKAYQFQKHGSGFIVLEGLAASAPFRPYVQIRVACDSGGSCAARDAACLWRPEKVRAAFSSSKTWEERFAQVLNGDKQALVAFDNPPAAATSEAYYTLRADVLRLKALGCIR